MTVPMALCDFVPVLLYAAAVIVLQRCLYSRMSKGCYAVFSAGTLMSTCAGLFKATWKLLYAANVCDFEKLSQCFFPMQSVGFLLSGLALVAMLCHKQNEKKAYAIAAPAVFGGTMIFVSAMCVGVIAAFASLGVIAHRMKKNGLCVLFILAGIGMLGMGYLSSKDFEQAMFHWIAEGTNTLAQALFLLGAVKLQMAGVADFRFEKN